MAVYYMDLALVDTGHVGSDVDPWSYADYLVWLGGGLTEDNEIRIRGSVDMTGLVFEEVASGSYRIDYVAWDSALYGPWRVLCNSVSGYRDNVHSGCIMQCLTAFEMRNSNNCYYIANGVDVVLDADFGWCNGVLVVSDGNFAPGVAGVMTDTVIVASTYGVAGSGLTLNNCALTGSDGSYTLTDCQVDYVAPAMPLWDDDVTVFDASVLFADVDTPPEPGNSPYTGYETDLWGNDRTGIGTGLFADTVPPLWSSSYPTVTGVTGSGATINVSVNEDGTAYFVVLPSGAAAPSSAQVKAGTDASDVVVAAGFSGNVSVDADTPEVMTASNLVSETDYDVYVVVEDLLLNIQSSPVVLNFTTLDITDPEWVATYPKVDAVTVSTISVLVELTENGNVYGVVLPKASVEPTPAQVKAGTDADDVAVATGFSASTAVVASTEAALAFSNMLINGDYEIYIIGEDASDNLMDTVVRLTATTLPLISKQKILPSAEVGQIISISIGSLVVVTTKDFPTIFKMAAYPGTDYEIVSLGEKVVEIRILGEASTTRLISLKVGDGIVVSDEFLYKVQVVKAQRPKEKPISYGGTNVSAPDPFTPAFRRVQ